MNGMNTRAWLVIAAGDDRQYGGNDGYKDEIATSYAWDSTVPNHRNVAKGDLIVLWDKRALLGVARVDRIDEGSGTKLRHRCPVCRSCDIKNRKKKVPVTKCSNCGHLFDVGFEEIIDVMTYRTDHSSSWIDLEGVLDGRQLRGLAVSPMSRHAIRELREDDFREALSARGITAVP